MNYEQKYNEALDAAKHIYDDMKSGGNFGGMEDLEVIFPELRESEDERIRKFLIDILNHGTWKKEWPFSPPECISWLEKLKEQKVDIDKLRKDIYQSGYNDGYQHGKEDEQKEQKPAEWSEEDEENFKWFDKFFRAESVIAGGRDIPQGKYLWFKSLRPQPHWEPSEEQMEALDYVRQFDYGGHKAALVSLYEQLNELI